MCAALDVPVMVHTGTSVFPRARNKYGDPMDLDDVIVDFPDLKLIVAHGGRPLWMNTAQFLLRHRESLFPQVPLLLTAIDSRLLPRAAMQPGDTAVATHVDLPRAFESLLRLRPDTRSIAIVLGNTPLERYWRQELERSTAPLALTRFQLREKRSNMGSLS